MKARVFFSCPNRFHKRSDTVALCRGVGVPGTNGLHLADLEHLFTVMPPLTVSFLPAGENNASPVHRLGTAVWWTKSISRPIKEFYRE